MFVSSRGRAVRLVRAVCLAVAAVVLLPEGSGAGVVAVDAAPLRLVSRVVAAPAPVPEAAPAPVPPPAPEVVVDEADRSPGWEARLGAAAMSLIDFDVDALGYTVEFAPARPGRLGTTYPKQRRIVVWVRPGQSLPALAHVVAHEVGHAVDVTWNDAARRSRYRALRGLDGRGWFTCDGCTDFATPAGDFAEVFAHWALDGATQFRSQLGSPPDDAQLASLVGLFSP